MAGAAFVLSVEIACFSGETINHSGKRADLLPFCLVCFSSCSAAPPEEAVTGCLPA